MTPHTQSTGELEDIAVEHTTSTLIASEVRGTLTRLKSFRKVEANTIARIEALIRKEAYRLASEVIASGQKAIDDWTKHAYSMEAYANDTIVYSGNASKEQLDRRNDDVTDRRAILLASHLIKEQTKRLQSLIQEDA